MYIDQSPYVYRSISVDRFVPYLYLYLPVKLCCNTCTGHDIRNETNENMLDLVLQTENIDNFCPFMYVRRRCSLGIFSRFSLSAVGEMGMATAPVVCLATWALFGIQEIGLLIEDPFQVTWKPLLDFLVQVVPESGSVGKNFHMFGPPKY